MSGNRLITMKELTAGFNKMLRDNEISEREVCEVLAYGITCAYTEDEQRQVREFLGLELPPAKQCISCGSAIQPCCGH